MPGKRKYASKRKTKGRRNMRRKSRVNVNRALQPVAQRYICKMKYAEQASTDGNGHFYFNLNSIFDPNRTGIGHQPYGHDTLQTLYNRYRVISCGWRIIPTGVVSATLAPITYACMPANEQLLFGSMSEIRENPRAKYIVVNPGAPAIVMSGKSYLPSLVGRTKAQYMADDRYQAQFGSSPSELSILNIVASSSSSQDTPTPGVIFNIILEYTVECFDVKHLAQS